MGSQHAKRFKLKRGLQCKFFLVLMNKLELSQRKLARKLGVSRSALKNWIHETRLIPENIFHDCIKLLPELSKYEIFIINVYPENWGRIKGGKARSKMKSNLTKEIRIKGFRKANVKTIKRKVVGPNGERMYNNSERKLAEFFSKRGLKYTYEPAINLGNKYAFPDFLVKNTIIERCGYSDWLGYWNRVIEKIKLYEKYFKGKFIIVVPENRFKIAKRKISRHIRNVIILKETEFDTLSDLIT